MCYKPLPCPFCGGDDLKVEGDDKIVHLYCRTCQATGPNQYREEFDWNARTDSKRIAELEEGLRNSMEQFHDISVACQGASACEGDSSGGHEHNFHKAQEALHHLIPLLEDAS